MTRFLDRRKALELRKLGKSYSQIKNELGVSKSTLSEWLKAYPLTKAQIDTLRGKSEIRIEKYRQTMRRKREARLTSYYKEEKSKWIPLSKRELFLMGLFLYWGEGGKTHRNIVSINNTDPSVIKFAFYWLNEVCKVSREKIQVYLHLYSDMNITEAMAFWSKELQQPIQYFAKPYIKKSKRTDLDQKGFGHGTCGLRVYNTILKEHILVAIQVVADHYGEKLEKS